MKNNLFLIFAFSTVVCTAQSPDTLQRIDQLFSKWNNATPGISVAIERNGKIIYHKAYGLADIEHNVPNTTATILEGGSVSKQFTAAAILLLAAEGKLSLDDDVRKFVPELPVYDKTITIRHLMNHTSGLKDWGSVASLSGWPRTTRIYTHELALEIICRQKSLNFSPGSEYSYSNSGYTLMVIIVERITKNSFAEFTRTRLFEPAGMKNTKWRNNFREIVPGRAVAYRRIEGGYEQEMPFENVHGNGGLLTTTEDLITWNHQLSMPTIGGDGMVKLRTQQGKLTNNQTISYAGGLFIAARNGFREVSHTGSTAGYRAYLGWFPEKKLAIALLSNDATFSPGAVGGQVADVFLGKPPEPMISNRTSLVIPEESLRKYEGIYRAIRIFDAVTLTFSDSKLMHDGRTFTVLHRDTLLQGRTYWISKGNNQILLKSPVDTFTYVKVKAPVATPSYLQSLAGTYYSEEADATWKIEVKAGELWVHQIPPGDWKLAPAFYDGFFVDGEDLYEFKRNKKGAVDRLEVSISRAERVLFIRKGK